MDPQLDYVIIDSADAVLIPSTSNVGERKTLLKTDKNIKTGPIITDTKSADKIKQISDSNSVDLENTITDSNSVDSANITDSNSEDLANITDSNSVELPNEITGSNSIDSIKPYTGSNAVEIVYKQIKSITDKPAVNGEKSENRVNPNENQAVSPTFEVEGIRTASAESIMT